MRFCLILTGFWLAAPALWAASATRPLYRATFVVRPDARTGRLVRAAAVRPQVVSQNVVRPRVINPPAPAVAATPAADSSLHEYIDQTAVLAGVDPLLVHAVIAVESGYNPFAVSAKGAQGIMQLVPATARRFGVRNSFDPQENIQGGVRYLRYLSGLFGPDNLRLVLAAYNAGEEAVLKYNAIPPYLETINYVYQVGKRYGRARRGVESRAPAQVGVGGPRPPDTEAWRPVKEYRDAQGVVHLRNTP